MLLFPQNMMTYIVFFSQKNLLNFFFLGQHNLKIHQKTIFEKVGPIVENEDGKVSKRTITLPMSSKRWKMNGLKRTRRNFWNISHAKLSIIVGIFSCHVDSNYVMWHSIPWWGLKYFVTWIRVPRKTWTTPLMVVFKWCFWFATLTWEGFEKWKC